MITTVADLLKGLMDKEKESIKEFEFVKHGPMIGQMYEGLTNNILEKSLPKNLDIRVVSGMIKNSNGELSHQTDCMIVEGEGKKLPHSNDYVYPCSQVLAVIEVKKNLYLDDLIDSHQKMRRIFEITDHEPIKIHPVRDAFKQIAHKELPEKEQLVNLNLTEQMLYHTLIMEEVLPLRIVFGYYGYTSEYSLRKSFINYLGDNMSPDLRNLKKGFGPINFPNLIVARNSSLVKLNAMPYVGNINENGFWDVYASSSHNPLLHLLELLWTRLTYRYNISTDIFGEDLEAEVLHRYISARPKKVDNQTGWEYNYHYVEEKALRERMDKYEWMPAELDDQEYMIVNWLCNGETLNVDEDFFVDWLKKEKRDVDDIIASLREKGLAYLNDKREIELLTDECRVVLYGGKAYAAEDKSGRLTRWVLKQVKNKQK